MPRISMSDHLKKVLFEKWVNFEAAEAVVVLLFCHLSGGGAAWKFDK